MTPYDLVRLYPPACQIWQGTGAVSRCTNPGAARPYIKDDPWSPSPETPRTNGRAQQVRGTRETPAPPERRSLGSGSDLATRRNHHGLVRASRARSDGLDGCDDLLAAHHLAKDHMLAIQVRRGACGTHAPPRGIAGRRSACAPVAAHTRRRAVPSLMGVCVAYVW
jgi:hypothetical protein